jgi:hypothetical protein
MPSKPPKKDAYEQVDTVPADMRWKPAPFGGRAANNLTVMYTIGNFYKLVRVRATGEVTYYRLKDQPEAATPKEKIDAEPAKAKQVRYKVGANAWFVIDGRWFLIRVVKREPGVIVIAPVNALDADRQASWPHPPELEFSPKSNTFSHLRPLKARYT